MLDFHHDFDEMPNLIHRMSATRPVNRQSEAKSNCLCQLLAFIVIAALALLSACGAQNSMVPAITVTFTPGFAPPTAMTVSEQCGVAATLTNDTKNQGVKWTATCGSASCGIFTPTAASASGIPITYTSPAVAPAGGTVTLIATSVTDSTKNATSTPIPIGTNSSGCTAP
jgi:hypothetical protein